MINLYYVSFQSLSFFCYICCLSDDRSTHQDHSKRIEVILLQERLTI